MSRVLIWSITAITLAARGNYTTFATGESSASFTAWAMIFGSSISGCAGIAARLMSSSSGLTARCLCETEGKRRCRLHSRNEDRCRLLIAPALDAPHGPVEITPAELDVS